MTKTRWQKLMQAMGLPDSLDTYEALCKAYGEKHRHYHTAAHINAMLRHFDQTKVLAEHPHELELAIWFHDAIYQPFSTSNEQDSAVWAKEFLAEQQFDQAGIERVYNLIMATVHQQIVKDQDARLMVDIDLTILGTPADVYDQFEKNIRKEYRLVPAFIYRKQRKRLLQGFLSQDSLYHLKYYQDRFEAQARINLTRAIDQL